MKAVVSSVVDLQASNSSNGEGFFVLCTTIHLLLD